MDSYCPLGETAFVSERMIFSWEIVLGFGDADLQDGIHPTKAGAVRMAERWMEGISTL